MRHKIGDRETCARCSQEIEFHGHRNWRDRGNNRTCPSYIKDGEIVRETDRHVHRSIKLPA